MFKDPGNQGPAIAGTHGIGVRTPIAAAVALATKGFAIEVHIPHVGTFKMGFESEIFPPGLELTRGAYRKYIYGGRCCSKGTCNHRTCNTLKGHLFTFFQKYFK